jgi:protein-tyrosine-phosphatase/predicted ATP-grasp superfamily ATP-dependent carboligase
MRPHLDRPLRILVTDGQELAALGAIRSLGRAGHRVVVARAQQVPVAAAGWSRFCAERTKHPDPWEDHQQFVEWLAGQGRSGQYDVILPISEASIVAAETVRPALAGGPHLLMPRSDALSYSLSKAAATRLAMAAGLTVPPTVFLDDAGNGDVDRAGLAALRFPIVVKTDNYLAADGSYVKGRTTVSRTLDEAIGLLDVLRSLPTSIIAQERVGTGGAGAFLLRHDGEIVLRFAHRRLHEVPYSGGMSSLRASSHDAAVIQAGERLLDAMDYQGVAMIEVREAPGGEPFFLEINGRLWGSLALALHAGVDFPRAWLEAQLFGASSPSQADYPDGLLVRDAVPGELQYVRSVLRARPAAGEPTPPSKTGALVEFARLTIDRRVRSDTLWNDDPLPWVGSLTVLGAQVLGKARRGAGRLVNAPGNWRRRQAARRDHAARLAHDGYALPADRAILFLCHGNICRSAFAERYWQRLLEQRGLPGPVARSAGLTTRQGRGTPPHCLREAKAFGVDLGDHRSRPVDRALVDAAEWVFVMDVENARAFAAAFPGARHKVSWLGAFDPAGPVTVADPYLLDASGARRCFARLARALDALMDRVAGEPALTPLAAPQPAALAADPAAEPELLRRQICV